MSLMTLFRAFRKLYAGKIVNNEVYNKLNFMFGALQTNWYYDKVGYVYEMEVSCNNSTFKFYCE